MFYNIVLHRFGTSVLFNKNSLDLFLSCAPTPPPPQFSENNQIDVSNDYSWYILSIAVEVANQSTQSSDKLTDVTEVVPTTWGGTTQSTQRNDKPDENNVVSSQMITNISFGVIILLLVLCFVLCFWWSHRKRKLRCFILVICASYLD